MNYFELFGLTPRLEINLTELQQKYFALQQQFHPDKNKDGIAESARLNEAYSTLKNRFKRLEYVVKTQYKGELKADQAFLTEIMEISENPDVPAIKAEIDGLHKQAELAFKENNLDDVANKFTRIKYLQNVIANSQ